MATPKNENVRYKMYKFLGQRNVDAVFDIVIYASIGLIITVGFFLVRGLIQKPEKKETTEVRVERLTTALREATALISSIESEVKSRSKLAMKLQNDIESYNQLLNIKKPEVEAVAQLLRGELEKQGKKSLWKEIGINFVFFVMGVGTTRGVARYRQ